MAFMANSERKYSYIMMTLNKIPEERKKEGTIEYRTRKNPKHPFGVLFFLLGILR
jgi:hypothetical protein